MNVTCLYFYDTELQTKRRVILTIITEFFYFYENKMRIRQFLPRVVIHGVVLTLNNYQYFLVWKSIPVFDIL